MEKEEALKIVQAQYPKTQVSNIIDYKHKKMFVFVLGKVGEFRVSNTVAVMKDTGKLIAFNPLKFDPKEYKKAVEESRLK